MYHLIILLFIFHAFILIQTHQDLIYNLFPVFNFPIPIIRYDFNQDLFVNIFHKALVPVYHKQHKNNFIKLFTLQTFDQHFHHAGIHVFVIRRADQMPPAGISVNPFEETNRLPVSFRRFLHNPTPFLSFFAAQPALCADEVLFCSGGTLFLSFGICDYILDNKFLHHNM